MEDGHLTPRQAAGHITMSVSWLEKRRRDGKGPPWHRVPGTRRVYYDQDELDQWMGGLSDHPPVWFTIHKTDHRGFRVETVHHHPTGTEDEDEDDDERNG